MTLTQHVYSPIPLTISEKTWQQLSPADRDAVTQGRAGGGGLEPQGGPRQRRAQLADMQSKGAKIARPNLAPFRQAVQPAYAKAKEKYGADVDAVLAEAEVVRKAMPGR